MKTCAVLRRILPNLCAALLLPGSLAAVTFSVSPPVISNTYTGYITLQITGLTNGETVSVANYVDVNNNGTLDNTDMLMQAIKLTDGQRAIIGGATNLNVAGDSTGADGTIISYIPFLAKEPQQGIGRHLLQLSSPTSNFSPVVASLTVTNSQFGQAISGNITCASTNVPYAVVVVLSASSGGKGDFITDVPTDGNGAYSVSLPPGNFQLLAFRPGYVLSMATAPQVSLSAGVNATANITLLPATQVLAGRVVKSSNTNSPIPGLFMVFESASGLLTVGSTDTNGYFSVPVQPDGWKASVESSSVAPIGFVAPQSKPRFDTTAGSVTNALILLTKGTALVYGTINSSVTGPMGGVSFFGNNDTNTLESTGWSDPYGNYSVVTTAGNWWVGLDLQSLSTNLMVGGANQVSLLDGQAVRQDLVVVPTSATISGTVKDQQGLPVSGVDLWCSGTQSGVVFNSNGQTDATGHYTLATFNGSWMLGFGCDGPNGLRSMGYACPGWIPVSIPPTNLVKDFVVYPVGTPHLDPPFITSGTQLAITLYGEPGTNYLVQYSTNLANTNGWNTLTTVIPTSGVTTVWDNNATNAVRFYRARIW